jgi:hypothetical protein
VRTNAPREGWEAGGKMCLVADAMGIGESQYVEDIM